MSSTGARPALIQYGRSSKKLLAKRASQAAPSPPSEPESPPAATTTTQPPARKRARPDSTPAPKDTPRKRAKASTVSDASPKPADATPSPSIPLKRRATEDAAVIASTSRPSPAKRRTTISVKEQQDDPLLRSTAPPARKPESANASPNRPATRRSRRDSTIAQAPPPPPTPSGSRAKKLDEPKRLDTAANLRSTSPKHISKPTADPDNIFYTPASKVAAAKSSDVKSKIPSPELPPVRSPTPQAPLSAKLPTPAKPPSRSPPPVQEPVPPATKPKSPSKSDALSQLFSNSATGSPRSPTKQGVAKRMLARSKTESSISVDSTTGSLSSPSSPAKSRIGGSPAMLRAYTSMPAVGSSSTIPEPVSTNVSPIRPKTPTVQNNRPTIRTYANARSFLVQLPPSAIPADLKLELENVEASQPDDEIEAELRHTAYSTLRDADEAQGLGLATDLRSGTEMKEHGLLRRFMDDVGYILEGLESPMRGVQRTSAIELLEKMGDEAFVRKARSADVLSRAWTDFGEMKGGAEDPILVLCMGIFCAIASKEMRDLDALTGTRHFGEVVLKLLAVEPGRDVLRLPAGRIPQDFVKRLGLKRTDVPLMESVRKVVQDSSSLFASSFPVSSPKLASIVLAVLPSRSVQQTWTGGLVTSVERELKLVDVYLSVQLDGDFMQVDEQTGTSMPDVQHLRHCMRILDGHLLGDEASATEALLSAYRTSFSHGLVQSCTMGQLLLADGAEQTIANDLIDTTLRVLVNLTNGSEEWCDALLDGAQCMRLLARLIVGSHQARKRVTAPREGEADPLDRLCLALALLTNLVQGSTRTADAWDSIQVGRTCKSESACLRECTCAEQTAGLKALHGIYIEQSVKTESEHESPEAQFLHGHLAILLALLAHQSPRTADVLRREADLKLLLTAGREWVATYELTQRRLGAVQRDAQRGVVAVNNAVEALAAML